ncbi:hypothetical protein OYG15_10940, partial [Actinobacillus pleuropneumoniae]|uniref:hypothetical protein n=1 Tax=Actinobacillus pleuropneumoniae TaxID=715 RepID=UPI002278843C
SYICVKKMKSVNIKFEQETRQANAMQSIEENDEMKVSSPCQMPRKKNNNNNNWREKAVKVSSRVT